MVKIKIQFPQIIIAEKEIEVTEAVFEQMKTDFDFKLFVVWSKMTESEQAQTTGKSLVKDFHQMDACQISSVDSTPSVINE